MQDIKPGLEVVVVTAHSQYALEAFKVHASGFLLKPVGLRDALDLLRTVMLRKYSGLEIQETPQKEKRMYVSSFGSFAIYTNAKRPRY
ncbi:MAG: hypothetical protein SCK57_06600 [Bacillota bacterium]|nr:hypothetical protein [Bacillota bacterium]MDW7677315.1 hypothetical protein [Bacillota bacterium]